MAKILRPYQQEALNTLRLRLKQSPDPQLVDASVGAGKSLIIAAFLLKVEQANWHALCLTMNSTLIQQNSETYADQGGDPGIYCSGLGEKNSSKNVIFGSPHSIVQAIKKKDPVSKVKFNVIVVDEAHNINHNDKSSMYMRILNHYGLMAQADQYQYRVIGLTGTPYRGKAISIVGEKEYFKDFVCSIDMTWLIGQGFLVPPIFGKPKVKGFDMKHIRMDNTGKFKGKDLQAVVDQDDRLTGYIMEEIVEIVESGRNGAFIFASTVKHAHECMRSLPPDHSACITGETSHELRKKILTAAREGSIKYLVNVATLLVGVDVPNFDVCAWLRPTESLTLYTQGIGRVLRLSPDKKDALVLDYAGNVERHGDIDDPIINAAVQPDDEEDPDYCIPCYECQKLNKVTARRCIGKIDKKRCDYFFTFKNCEHVIKHDHGTLVCDTENDITARHCRKCGGELIDPNKKLDTLSELTVVEVIEAKYWVTEHSYSSTPIVNVKYATDHGQVFESYWTNSQKACNIFYGKFIKFHVEHSSEIYPYLNDFDRMKELIYSDDIKTPSYLVCKKDAHNRFLVMKKLESRPSDHKTI